jgi:putative addiction module component (TIGR02574 family)
MAESNIPELLRRALELPAEDRLALATELLNSVEGPEDEDWSDAWAEELGRRLAEVERGEVKLEPWETVKARILADLQSR